MVFVLDGRSENALVLKSGGQSSTGSTGIAGHRFEFPEERPAANSFLVVDPEGKATYRTVPDLMQNTELQHVTLRDIEGNLIRLLVDEGRLRIEVVHPGPAAGAAP